MVCFYLTIKYLFINLHDMGKGRLRCHEWDFNHLTLANLNLKFIINLDKNQPIYLQPKSVYVCVSD